MQALVTAPNGAAGVQTVPVPEPSAGEIRVRVKAVALNPVDSMFVAHQLSGPGRTIGSDFAGVIDAIGSPVDGRPSWKVGDRVAGFLHGACQQSVLPGAFAQYLTVDSDLVYKIPDDLSFAEASTIPLCANTATNGLFRVLDLPAPWSSKSTVTGSRPALLIYSAATSVGIYAIQLARLSPAKPFIVTTASPKNAQLLKELGADVVINYRDADWVEQAVAAVKKEGLSFSVALDCISEGETTKTISKVFEGKGKIAAVLPPGYWETNLKEGIEAEYMAVWTLLGKAFKAADGSQLEARPDHRKLAEGLYAYLSSTNSGSPLLNATFRHNKPRIMPGGLANIPEAFPLFGAGGVTDRGGESEAKLKPLSAEKLVYVIEN